MASLGQKDIIKPFTYDNADRKNKDYIPYEAIASGSYTGTGGQFDANFSTNQQTFIKNLFGDINKEYGFTEYQYEESPLNRVLKQSAPGSDWALYPNSPSQEHVTEFEYSPNTSQINSWIYENNTFEPITYNSQQLFVTTTENENTGLNRSITNEYKDKTGLLIMSENLINGTSYQTKYIYDDLRLLNVLFHQQLQHRITVREFRIFVSIMITMQDKEWYIRKFQMPVGFTWFTINVTV